MEQIEKITGIVYICIDLCAFRMAVQGALEIHKPSPIEIRGFG